MNKKNKMVNGKMMITSKSEFDLMRSMMTKEKFFDKFVLSIELTTRIAAEEAMAYVAFTDVSSVYINNEKRRLGLN